jgi:hypothetical protein
VAVQGSGIASAGRAAAMGTRKPPALLGGGCGGSAGRPAAAVQETLVHRGTRGRGCASLGGGSGRRQSAVAIQGSGSRSGACGP